MVVWFLSRTTTALNASKNNTCFKSNLKIPILLCQSKSVSPVGLVYFHAQFLQFLETFTILRKSRVKEIARKSKSGVDRTLYCLILNLICINVKLNKFSLSSLLALLLHRSEQIGRKLTSSDVEEGKTLWGGKGKRWQKNDSRDMEEGRRKGREGKRKTTLIALKTER